MKIHKKGQTEDIFADLIPAVAIILVTVFIGTFVIIQHRGGAEDTLSSFASMPLKEVALLKTPVSLPNLPQAYNELTLGEVAGAIQDKHGLMLQGKESYKWLEEAGIASGTFSVEQAVMEYYGREEMLDCGGEFREFLHKILLGSDETWGYLLEPFKAILLGHKPPELWMVELYSLGPTEKVPFYVCVSPFANYNYLLSFSGAQYKTITANFTIPSQEPSRQVLVAVTFFAK